MKHGKICPAHLTVSCPALLADALLVPRLSLFMEMVSGVDLKFTSTQGFDGLGAAAICLSETQITDRNYISEPVGDLSHHAYGPNQGPIRTWVGGSESEDHCVQDALAEHVFGAPPKLRIADNYLRIIAAKRAGLGVILPDVIGRLDPELSQLSSDCIHLGVWMSVDRRASGLRGLHQAVIWVRGCLDAMAWLNDAPTDPIWQKSAK